MDLGRLVITGLSKDVVMYNHTVQNGMVQERGQGTEGEGREREGGRGRWVDLVCLMTPGLSKDIQCHV